MADQDKHPNKAPLISTLDRRPKRATYLAAFRHSNSLTLMGHLKCLVELEDVNPPSAPEVTETPTAADIIATDDPSVATAAGELGRQRARRRREEELSEYEKTIKELKRKASWVVRLYVLEVSGLDQSSYAFLKASLAGETQDNRKVCLASCVVRSMLVPKVLRRRGQ